MGLLDFVQKAASALPNAANLGTITDLAFPQELQNLVASDKMIAEKTQALSTALAAGTAQTSEIAMLRSQLTFHHNHIEDGGEPAPDALVKATILAHPKFAQVKANYPNLEAGVAALETQYPV